MSKGYIDLSSKIIDLLATSDGCRPEEEIVTALGFDENEAIRRLAALERNGEVSSVTYDGDNRIYWGITDDFFEGLGDLF